MAVLSAVNCYLAHASLQVLQILKCDESLLERHQCRPTIFHDRPLAAKSESTPLKTSIDLAVVFKE